MAKWTEPTPTTHLATLTLEGQPVEVSFIVDDCDDEGGTEWLLDLVKIGGAWVAAVDALSTQFCMVLQEALRAEEAAFYGAASFEPEPAETHARHSVINERGQVVVA